MRTYFLTVLFVTSTVYTEVSVVSRKNMKFNYAVSAHHRRFLPTAELTVLFLLPYRRYRRHKASENVASLGALKSKTGMEISSLPVLLLYFYPDKQKHLHLCKLYCISHLKRFTTSLIPYFTYCTNTPGWVIHSFIFRKIYFGLK